jgi:hypothetical protein
MAKTKVSEFDAVASNNTDINSVNVAEGCPPSGINNAIREMASLLKKQEVGTDAMTSPDIDGGTIDGATIGGSSGVTIGVSDGTVSAPSIKFTSDTNTGIYRGGTDILKFVTAGTDAITIDASQNVTLAGSMTGTTVTLSTSDNNPQLTITSTDADANAGPEAVFDRNSSSPADADRIGKLTFKGRNDANQVVEYGNIQSRIIDASDGTEDGRIIIQNIIAGDVAGVMESNSTETIFNENSKDLDFRIESISNANAFFLEGSSGNVGIGKIPTTTLDIKAGSPIIQLEDNDAGGAYSQINATGTEGSILITADAGNVASNTHIDFRTDGTEAMRIDDSQNLLVGTTTTAGVIGGSSVTGSYLSPDGGLFASRSGDAVAHLNRQTSDGEIIELRKDGTTVGQINTVNSDMIIGSNDVGLYFDSVNDQIRPATATGNTVRGSAIDLGRAGGGFKDLYLSGTIEIEQGTGNVAVGKDALAVNTGTNNLAVGVDALDSNGAGSNNVALGIGAGNSNVSGSDNTFVGRLSGNASNTTGDVRNTFVGYLTGYNTSTGTANTFIGAGPNGGSGESITSGSKNSILGPFNGNQGNLDIRTSNNNIVLSDGDGNARGICDSSGSWELADNNLNSTLGDRLNIYGKTVGGTQFGIAVAGNANGYAQYAMRFYDAYNSAVVGSITFNTTSTSYNTSSDHRLKENVIDMTGAIDRVKQLSPKRFNFIVDSDTTVDGFLAHEAQAVVAEAVTGTHNEVDDDGNAIMQSIDQSKLVPLLTGALKEAIAKIEELEARITALENA